MNAITLPFHLIIPALISILILGFIGYNKKRLFGASKWKWFWISLTTFLFLYVVLIGSAIYSGVSAELALQKFDLNKDGFFSGDEISLEQRAAMKKVTSDTGRNFIVITGLLFSGMIAVVVFVVGKTAEYLKNRKRTN
ncbi:hypothetical protein ADIWIN_1925 [Winogradskyella psychrotolerans RS-3]|uniref:Uncharacterized protein n=1 Tax=Winogradskyella psychrotolerans RS-3 TaxID=641526 RepID=S7X2A5_9FLAO|nr:hypothetical protein [Winogradskyella psychrotolerans]EPR73144.1 hypothetical protein ADIWIN_1925 [Winogradskyella psychrotolerans RS-3]